LTTHTLGIVVFDENDHWRRSAKRGEEDNELHAGGDVRVLYVEECVWRAR
jgi:hypothetical protein